MDHPDYNGGLFWVRKGNPEKKIMLKENSCNDKLKKDEKIKRIDGQCLISSILDNMEIISGRSLIIYICKLIKRKKEIELIHLAWRHILKEYRRIILTITFYPGKYTTLQ